MLRVTVQDSSVIGETGKFHRKIANTVCSVKGDINFVLLAIEALHSRVP